MWSELSWQQIAGILSVTGAIGRVSWKRFRSQSTPSLINRMYHGVLTLAASKWDRDQMMELLGIDPLDPAARRMAVTEIDRLQRLSAGRDDSPPLSIDSTGKTE